MLHRNSVLFFLGLLVFVFSSCSDKAIFTEYQSLSDATWKAHEKIDFQFEITDTISPKNMFINIRNNSQYEFNNLFVITTLEFPSGTKVVDTLHYEMADGTGQFLGQGFTEIKENKLFYKEQKLFPESGEYYFSIYQAMRKNGAIEPIAALKGIQEVGISIENY